MTTALLVHDPETDAVVRKLASLWGVSCTAAIRRAAEAALAARAAETEARRAEIAALVARLDSVPRTGQLADKTFFDALSGS